MWPPKDKEAQVGRRWHHVRSRGDETKKLALGNLGILYRVGGGRQSLLFLFLTVLQT